MNHKKRFLSFILTLMMTATMAVPANAHYDTAYWNEGTRAQTRSGWMHRLPDSMLLSQVSLPGTHDSMSWSSSLTGLDVTRTQTADISEQLAGGIRVLDIRVKNENNAFECYHGIVWLGGDFDHVLRSVQTFLENNPTETVLMRFSQENSSTSDAAMLSVFNSYLNRYPNLFYRGENKNPTIGQVRGKLVLISNVLSLNQYGINYRLLDKQDDYHLVSNWDLYGKWEKIKAHFNKTQSRADKNTIYMNYLSGSGGSLPYFVASGHVSPGTAANRLSTIFTEPGFPWKYPDFPRVDRFGIFSTIAFEGTNTLTADWLSNTKPSYCGIVMADFPGQRLINAIIDCNF